MYITVHIIYTYHSYTIYIYTVYVVVSLEPKRHCRGVGETHFVRQLFYLEPKVVVVSATRESPAHKHKRKDTRHTEPPKGDDP